MSSALVSVRWQLVRPSWEEYYVHPWYMGTKWVKVTEDGIEMNGADVNGRHGYHSCHGLPEGAERERCEEEAVTAQARAPPPDLGAISARSPRGASSSSVVPHPSAAS